MLGNTQAGRPDGKCNREQTADGLRAQARVKRWCKRPPASRATGAARQTPPGARPSRDRAARPMSRVGRSSPPVTAGPDRWPSPASAGTESGLQADSTKREGPFGAPHRVQGRFSRPGTLRVCVLHRAGSFADREDDMAQTTWNDPELRRRLLVGLSALTDGSPQRRRGRPLLAGLSMVIGIAIAVALL